MSQKYHCNLCDSDFPAEDSGYDESRDETFCPECGGVDLDLFEDDE